MDSHAELARIGADSGAVLNAAAVLAADAIPTVAIVFAMASPARWINHRRAAARYCPTGAAECSAPSTWFESLDVDFRPARRQTYAAAGARCVIETAALVT